jgi:predicted HicB family RNase H-like nuclease
MAKGDEKRTERFSMRLPASVHARLLKAANADHRSMADVALIAIEKYLNGLDNPSSKKR